MFDNDRLWDYVIAAIFAAFGGLAKLLSTKDKKRASWAAILSELFVAAFVGLMTLQIGIAMQLDGAWLGAACGAAGFMGARVMTGLIDIIGKQTGVDLSGKKGEKKQ
jgi:hypothetical protein